MHSTCASTRLHWFWCVHQPILLLIINILHLHVMWQKSLTKMWSQEEGVCMGQMGELFIYSTTQTCRHHGLSCHDCGAHWNCSLPITTALFKSPKICLSSNSSFLYRTCVTPRIFITGFHFMPENKFYTGGQKVVREKLAKSFA